MIPRLPDRCSRAQHGGPVLRQDGDHHSSTPIQLTPTGPSAMTETAPESLRATNGTTRARLPQQTTLFFNTCHMTGRLEGPVNAVEPGLSDDVARSAFAARRSRSRPNKHTGYTRAYGGGLQRSRYRSGRFERASAFPGGGKGLSHRNVLGSMSIRLLRSATPGHM